MQHCFYRILARIFYMIMALLVSSCETEKPKIPEHYKIAAEAAQIYPDYSDITIPPNIAPLNFSLKNDVQLFLVAIRGESGDPLLVKSDGDRVVTFSETAWKKVLQENQGKGLAVELYAFSNGDWIRYPDILWRVASEPIDSFLSYRLIEPGYELYRQLGLYQRDLTSYNERVIYENNRVYDDQNNHCINCHNYQNYQTDRMLFHVRAAHGGTVLATEDGVEKITIKHDSILSAGVYPTWHPNMNYVVFSTNLTGQLFHMKHKEKVEVLDEASDLIFYNVDKNEVHNIMKTQDVLETFPCWSADGKHLYYCAAAPKQLKILPDSLQRAYVTSHYDSLYYNIMAMNFDEKQMAFSQPQLIVDCASQHKSASVPRVSPDGRYLLFTMADYGQFHIWHKSADLWVKDMQKDTVYALRQTNSEDVDSYHTWSSNGRWIVFSSRRDDGNYTRVYIAYFDKSGQGHKAFILPQKNPMQNIMLLKSYNVPELTKNAVQWDAAAFKKAIYEQKGKLVDYKD